MSLFVSPATLSRTTSEFDVETPQIRFPVKFVTRCIFTYSFLLFVSFFAFYKLFAFISVVIICLALVYAFMIGKLFFVLGLSVWKYVTANILWWFLLALFATCVRSGFFTLLAPLL